MPERKNSGMGWGMAREDDSSKHKYPLPFDPFIVLTVLVPGAGLFLSLGYETAKDPVGKTVFGAAMKDPSKWYVYPALLVVAFAAGVMIDAMGRVLRAVLHRGAGWTLSGSTSDLLRRHLARSLSFTDQDTVLQPSELVSHINSMIVIASQVPRGKAFRAQERTLAMLTNVAVATALAAWLSPLGRHFIAWIVGASGLLLVTAVFTVLPRWWHELVMAASGVDMASFHEAELLAQERRLNVSETRLEQLVRERTETIHAELEEKSKNVEELENSNKWQKDSISRLSNQVKEADRKLKTATERFPLVELHVREILKQLAKFQESIKPELVNQRQLTTSRDSLMKAADTLSTDVQRAIADLRALREELERTQTDEVDQADGSQS